MTKSKSKKGHPSLLGKKPINQSKQVVKRKSTVDPNIVLRNPSHIQNRMKRSEVYGRYLLNKKARKRAERLKRAKEAEALGEDAPPKPTPKTLESTRQLDATTMNQSNLHQDNEIHLVDEANDEFAPYFDDTIRPKLLITTRPHPSRALFYFIADLQTLIPQLYYYPRKSYSIKEICTFASNRQFTHLLVLGEKAKKCNSLTISHLKIHDGHVRPGPTAFFKLSSVVTSENLPNHGCGTSHVAELNLNGFATRLGHRVGRLLGSLFPHNAELEGRQVVSFHNQRDYIFCRRHRYVFYQQQAKKQDKNEKKQQQQQSTTNARLQELGPRFTLKLRWIQEGTFDTQFGEYEWIHKRKEMDTTRRKFHL